MTYCSGKILVCLSETKWPSFIHVFLTMLLEKTLHLFPNVPGIKEKQILLKRKDVLGLLPTKFGKSLTYYIFEIKC